MTRILIANPLLYETAHEVATQVKSHAASFGLLDGILVQKKVRPADLPKGSTVIFDNPARIASNVTEFLVWVEKTLERDCELIGPGPLDLRKNSTAYPISKELVLFFTNLRHSFRRSKIREGIVIARSRGTSVGRARVPESTKALIIREHLKGTSVRKIVATLKGQGIEISKSSVHAVIKANKGKQ